MPGQTTKSGFAAKVGAKAGAAAIKHAGDATKLPGGGGLPDGIENGVARLIDCRFDEYKDGELKGEYFFLVAATVLHPKTKAIDGVDVKTEGKRIQKTEPVCDTPKNEKVKTMDDHVAIILNQMRLLGYDTKPFAKAKPDLIPGMLETAAAALKQAKPTFAFRTWKGKKQTTGPYKDKEPRINLDWNDKCKWDPSKVDDGIKDNTGGAPTEEHGAVEEPEPEPTPDSPEEEGTVATDIAMPEDLDELAEIALRDDDSDEMRVAQVTLTERAVALGKAEEADKTTTWAEVVEIIREAEAGGDDEVDYDALGLSADGSGEMDPQEAADKLSELGATCEPALDANYYTTWALYATAIQEALAPAEEAAEPEPFTPEVGDVYYYKPPKATKAIDCEVMAVDVDKRTMSLKNGVDKKTVYKGVSWDAVTDQP